jgi:hypothetical protein
MIIALAITAVGAGSHGTSHKASAAATAVVLLIEDTEVQP